MLEKYRVIKRIYIYIALIFFCAFFYGCRLKTEKEPVIAPLELQRQAFLDSAAIPVEDAPGVTPNKIRELNGDRLIAVDYPSVDANQKINDEVTKYIDQRLSEFKTETESMGTPTDETGLYTMRITYKPYVAENGMVSFKFTENIYSGMTNREEYITAMAFDGQTGNQVYIDELFNPSTNYLDTLATAARSYLKREESIKDELNTDLFNSGTEPNIQNYSNFVIMPGHKLGFYFNRNTIAPAEAGTISVILPVSDFFDVLNPQFRAGIYGDAPTAATQPQPSQPYAGTEDIAAQSSAPAPSSLTVPGGVSTVQTPAPVEN